MGSLGDSLNVRWKTSPIKLSSMFHAQVPALLEDDGSLSSSEEEEDEEDEDDEATHPLPGDNADPLEKKVFFFATLT